MSVPIKTAQFAEIYVIGAKLTNSTLDTSNLLDNSPSLVDVGGNRVVPHQLFKVGIATNLRVSESFGSRSRTVIGTPVPILTPGYYDGSISIEKATLDLHSFKSAVSVNPLVAYVPSVYSNNMVKILDIKESLDSLGFNGGALGDVDTVHNYSAGGKTFSITEKDLPPFLFAIIVKDKIIDAASTNFGAYIAMLQNFSVSLSSENAIILESVNAIARPYLATGWHQVLGDIFRTSPAFGYVYAPPQIKS